jgi:hypothetical protein
MIRLLLRLGLTAAPDREQNPEQDKKEHHSEEYPEASALCSLLPQ